MNHLVLPLLLLLPRLHESLGASSAVVVPSAVAAPPAAVAPSADVAPSAAAYYR